MSGNQIDVSDLTDFPTVVGEIIQTTFFPYPPTYWATLSPSQRQEFLDCAEEILAALKFHGWKP